MPLPYSAKAPIPPESRLMGIANAPLILRVRAHRSRHLYKTGGARGCNTMTMTVEKVMGKPRRRDGGQDHHQPDLFIFFTLASVASIDAASSRIAFASRSAASLRSCDRSARS